MIHDTNESPTKPIIPRIGSDSLQPETRRINQNVDLISIKDVVQVTDSGVINGQVSILQLNFVNVQNAGTVGAFWEVVVFVDSNTTTNVLYPYHDQSTVDLSQWQVLGLAGSVLQNGGPDYTPTTTYSEKMAIRNISAGTVDLIYQVRPRYIFNRG